MVHLGTLAGEDGAAAFAISDCSQIVGSTFTPVVYENGLVYEKPHKLTMTLLGVGRAPGVRGPFASRQTRHQRLR